MAPLHAGTQNLASLRAEVRATAFGGLHDEAVNSLTAVLARLESEQADPQQPQAELDAVTAITHAQLAEALRLAGSFREAFDHGLQADKLAEACGDVEARARALLALGHVCVAIGHNSEARERLAKVTQLDGVDPDLDLQARMNIASILRAEGDLQEAADAFDALQSLIEAASPALGASLLINAASCYHQLGRVDDGRQALARARDLLPVDARPDLWAWLDAITAWVELEGAEPDKALEAARAAVAPSRLGSSLSLRSSAARALAAVALAQGDPRLRVEAIETLQQVLSQAEAKHARSAALDLNGDLSTLCEAHGDLASAVQHLREAGRLQLALRNQDQRLRGEQESLRIEVMRMQVEADALLANRARLAQANRALVTADAARARLLSTLAHDLRGPLTNVMVTIDMVEPDDPDDVRSALSGLTGTVQRMVDMLEAAMAPLEHDHLDPVDAVAITRAIVDSFAALALRKEQVLRVAEGPPVPIRADPVSLGRLLDNLVSNALKYGPPGGAVDIGVRSRPRSVEITVADQGPGFPGLDPSEGMLYGHQLSTRPSGDEASWGLGLHTVYQLLAELGGILAIGNRDGGGAIVRVTLPRP